MCISPNSQVTPAQINLYITFNTNYWHGFFMPLQWGIPPIFRIVQVFDEKIHLHILQMLRILHQEVMSANAGFTICYWDTTCGKGQNIFYSICGNFLKKKKLESFLAANCTSTLNLQNSLLPNSSLQFLQQADDKAIFFVKL